MGEITSAESHEELLKKQAFDKAGYFTIQVFGLNCRIKVTEILAIERVKNKVTLKSNRVYDGLSNEEIDYIEQVYYNFLTSKPA